MVFALAGDSTMTRVPDIWKSISPSTGDGGGSCQAHPARTVPPALEASSEHRRGCVASRSGEGAAPISTERAGTLRLFPPGGALRPARDPQRVHHDADRRLRL